MKNKNKPKRDEDLIHKLTRDNEKLKKTISSLRKNLSRLDVDRYAQFKELLDSQDSAQNDSDKLYELDRLKKKWTCKVCEKDYLKLLLVHRPDGVFYYRKCQNCDHKTRLKKYTDDVKGVE
jgi:hypothetical protein